ARQRLPFAAALGQGWEGLIQGGRSGMVERCGLHQGFAPGALALINSKRRFGLRGISQISSPEPASASSTAWANRAPVGIAPASPTPFVPTGLSGERVSR